MRIRQVKPEFWSDAKMLPCPAWLRLFYIGLWMEADDAGWLRWDPEQIAMDILRDLSVTKAVARASEGGDKLVAMGRLRILPCGHAEVPKLADHQRLAGATRRVYTYRDEHKRCQNGTGES